MITVMGTTWRCREGRQSSSIQPFWPFLLLVYTFKKSTHLTMENIRAVLYQNIEHMSVSQVASLFKSIHTTHKPFLFRVVITLQVKCP